MSQDWRVDAYAEYIAKRKKLVAKHSDAGDQVARFANVQQEAAREIRDLDEAARVFGLEGISDQDTDTPELFDQAEAVHPGAFKDVALSVLKAAYPQPLRAAAIKEMVERRLGRTFHDKTPGMTLYRLSQDSKVRREGYNWFYVPHEQRPAFRMIYERADDDVEGPVK